MQLSATEVGILAGLPVALFAVAAVPASLLIARVGALRAVLSGMFLTALGSGLRAAAGEFTLLCAATTLMSIGVAVMQPALPPLVRLWLKGCVGFGTAVYVNGLLVGEILPVAIATPMLPLLGESWRTSLLFWSLPVLAIGITMAAMAPTEAEPARADAPWWPDWRSPLVWRLGLVFGGVTSMYFTTNGFLPVFLAAVGQSQAIGDALTALNLGQMPASLLLLVVADRLIGRVWPYIVAGVAALIAVAALVAASGPALIAASALLGFCCGAMLTLALALPPLLCAPEDVARTSAGMFTLSYGCAVLVPLVSGAAWDLTGVAHMAFLPIAGAALLLLALAPRNHGSSPAPVASKRACDAGRADATHADR
jgi:CP family cyanate transporter-like MFS transporter